MPLGAAYDKLAKKWTRYFERGHDEDGGAPSAQSAQQPAGGGGSRPGLFSKMGMRSTYGSSGASAKVGAPTGAWHLQAHTLGSGAVSYQTSWPSPHQIYIGVCASCFFPATTHTQPPLPFLQNGHAPHLRQQCGLCQGGRTDWCRVGAGACTRGVETPPSKQGLVPARTADSTSLLMPVLVVQQGRMRLLRLRLSQHVWGFD